MDNIVARLDNIDTVLTAVENPVGSTDGYYGGEDWTYDGMVLEDYPGVEYGPAVSSHDCKDVKSVLEVKLGPSFKLKKFKYSGASKLDQGQDLCNGTLCRAPEWHIHVYRDGETESVLSYTLHDSRDLLDVTHWAHPLPVR